MCAWAPSGVFLYSIINIYYNSYNKIYKILMAHKCYYESRYDKDTKSTFKRDYIKH